MRDDIFHHHDGVIDDQPDGRSETTERHQVEALAQNAQGNERDGDGHRNHQARNQRGAPVAQEHHHDERRQHQADENRIAHALDGIVHDFGLIVERQ